MVIDNIDQEIEVLDHIVREAKGSRYLDWNALLHNPPGVIPGTKNPEQVKEQQYLLVKYTVEEVEGSMWDVYHDHDRWSRINAYQDKCIPQIIGLSKKLKTINLITPEEKDLLVQFFDPDAGEYTSMPHTWFWSAIGKPQPSKSAYFNADQGNYEVPATALRNLLMFELGAFFKSYCNISDETKIEEQLKRMYPEEKLRQEFSLWIEYLHHDNNKISSRLMRGFPLHQWMWQSYHNLLTYRLFYPSVVFEQFPKPSLIQ